MNLDEWVADTPLSKYLKLIAAAKAKKRESKAGQIQRVYTQETKDKAVELYKAGLPIEEITDQLDANDWSVRRWIRQAGAFKKPEKYSAEKREEARKLFAEGHSYSSVSRLTGVPKSTVKHWKRKL